jgi:hypothetical protein
MIAVPVVQSAAGNVIDMVAVRRHRVATAVVAAVTGRRRAIRRILGGDFNDVFVVMIAVRRMHVALVQIISVIAVRHGRMPAIRAVNVGMIFMGCMIHGIFLTFVFNDDWPEPPTYEGRRWTCNGGAGIRKSTDILQRHEHPKKIPDKPSDALQSE